MPVGVPGPRQQRAHLPRAAWNDDLHGSVPPQQRGPAAAQPRRVAQVEREGRPPDQIVGQEQQSERQRQRAGVGGPDEPERPQQLAQQADEHQLRVARRAAQA